MTERTYRDAARSGTSASRARTEEAEGSQPVQLETAPGVATHDLGALMAAGGNQAMVDG